MKGRQPSFELTLPARAYKNNTTLADSESLIQRDIVGVHYLFSASIYMKIVAVIAYLLREIK